MFKTKPYLMMALAICVAQALTLKAEICLNHVTEGDQTLPSLALLSNGNIAVAWISQAPGNNSPRYNIFSPELEPAFEIELSLSQYTQHNKGRPYLAASEAGFFAGIFSHSYPQNDSDYDVFIKKIGNDGYPVTGEIRVNEDTSNQQYPVNVFIDDIDSIIVVAFATVPELGPEPSYKHLYIRLFDFDLNYLSEDVPLHVSDDNINGITAGFLTPSKVLAVWEQEFNIIRDWELWARHTNLDGSEACEPFILHTNSNGDFFQPYVLSNPSGGAAVFWGGIDEDSYASIWGRRLDSDGMFVDNEDIVISYPNLIGEGLHQIPSASYDFYNNMIYVTWTQNINGFTIIGRLLDYGLMPLSDTSYICELDYLSSWYPANTFVSDDSVFICWKSYFEDYLDMDVFGTVIQLPQTEIEHQEYYLPELSTSVYPNPFNSQTVIHYNLQTAAAVELSIYNVLGRKVKSLFDGFMSAGDHQFIWNASGFASGTYFCSIKTGDNTAIKTLVLLK